MPRIQRFAHTIQRLTYVNFFKPEQREARPDDVLVRDPEPPTSFAAWSATSFTGYVPYRNPPTR